MEEVVAFDPVDINFLGSNDIMFNAKHIADLVEQFGFGIGNNPVGRDDVIFGRPKGLQLPRKLPCSNVNHFPIDEEN
jgi:hypothetical protein